MQSSHASCLLRVAFVSRQRSIGEKDLLPKLKTVTAASFLLQVLTVEARFVVLFSEVWITIKQQA